MSDPVARLNAALVGRYAIERELCSGIVTVGRVPRRGFPIARGPAMLWLMEAGRSGAHLMVSGR